MRSYAVTARGDQSVLIVVAVLLIRVCHLSCKLQLFWRDLILLLCVLHSVALQAANAFAVLQFGVRALYYSSAM